MTCIKGDIFGATIAATYYLLAIKVFPNYLPFLRFPEQLPLESRLALGIKCLIPPAVMMLMGVHAVGVGRGGTVNDDPTSRAGSVPRSKRLAVNLRYLGNTHEQLLVHMITNMGMCVLLPGKFLHLVPLNALLFVLGRFMFWAGYHIDPLYRNPGFALTEFPTLAQLVYCAFRLIKG